MLRRLLLLSPLALAAVLFYALRPRPAPAPLPAGGDSNSTQHPTVIDDGSRLTIAPTVDRIAQHAGASAHSDGVSSAVVRAARARVVDARSKAPLAGARVRWSQGTRSGSGSTDAAGGVELDLDLLGAPVEITVRSAEHLPFERTLRPKRRYSIALHAPSTRLSGRVLEAESGVPVPYADIRVRIRGHQLATEGDAFGAYSLAGLPCDVQLRVSIAAEGFPAQHRALLLPCGSTELLGDFELAPGVLLRGRVVDRDTRAPVAGAVLRAGWIHDGVLRADDNGRFEVEHLPPNSSVRAEAPGYCTLELHFPREPSDNLELPLVRAGWIEGTVVDERGSPVAGANLSSRGIRARGVLAPGDDCPATWSYATDFHDIESDAQGAFRSPPIPRARGSFELHTRARGFAPHVTRVDVPATDKVVRVAIELARDGTARIRGRAILNGSPCPGRITWRGARQTQARDTPHGEYLLEGLAVGPTTLIFEPFGQRSASQWVAGLRRDVELQAGHEARVDFDLASELGEIRGRVTTPAGTPLKGEPVQAQLGSATFSAHTDANGAYRLELPALGAPYTVAARPRTPGARYTGIALGSVVDFVLPLYGDVRVRARDSESDRPLDDFGIAWSPAGDGVEALAARLAGPDPTGWSVATLPVGSVDLLATARGYLPARMPAVEVFSARRTPDLELELRPSLHVDLVLEKDCAPIPPGHFVFLVEQELWRGLRFEPRPGGPVATIDGRDEELASQRLVRFGGGRRARVVGLSAGPLRFKTIPNDIVIEPRVVTLPLAEAGPVRARWAWRQ